MLSMGKLDQKGHYSVGESGFPPPRKESLSSSHRISKSLALLMRINPVKCQGIFYMKVWYFYDKNNHKIRGGIALVLAGVMGCRLLGIFFHCYKGGSKRNPSFHPFDDSVWNRGVSPLTGSASKG
jgi:hypothetical protein